MQRALSRARCSNDMNRRTGSGSGQMIMGSLFGSTNLMGSGSDVNRTGGSLYSGSTWTLQL
ncbi:MAG: hypothetical protein AAB579_00275, partial [Patescibacteria group bacterium]